MQTLSSLISNYVESLAKTGKSDQTATIQEAFKQVKKNLNGAKCEGHAPDHVQYLQQAKDHLIELKAIIRETGAEEDPAIQELITAARKVRDEIDGEIIRLKG